MKDGKDRGSRRSWQRGVYRDAVGGRPEQPARLHAVVQIAGDGFRVEVGALPKYFGIHSTPALMLSRYAIVQEMQVAQQPPVIGCTTLSKGLRGVAHDPGPSGRGAVPITMIFLATMLGTDRPSVTMAAGVFAEKSWSGTRAAP